MTPEQITFQNNGISFTGDLYLPEGAGPWPVMVVLHAASFGLRTDVCYRHMAQDLPGRGVGVFIYDRRGCGQSGGDFETASFQDLADDARAAVKNVGGIARVDKGRFILYGISQGGWIAPLAAAGNPMVERLVIVSSSAVSPAAQMNYAAEYQLREKGYTEKRIELALTLRRMTDDYFHSLISKEELLAHLEFFGIMPWYKRAFLPNAADVPDNVRDDKWFYEMDYEPLPIWAKVKQATLFLFAETDRWVPVEVSRQLFEEHTRHLPVAKFETIPGATHMMTTSEDPGAEISPEYIQSLYDWLGK